MYLLVFWCGIVEHSKYVLLSIDYRKNSENFNILQFIATKLESLALQMLPQQIHIVAMDVNLAT